MRPELIFLCVILFNTCIRLMPVDADEASSENDTKKPSVSVQCQGLLRHGIVATGGETTGTTISFHRITWELQFADDSDREFAALHHKKPVLVTGALRKVVSTESMIRWIIDVKKISASDSRDSQLEGAQVTVRGALRAALSTTGDVPILSVRTDEETWRLDFAASREAQSAAELHIGQPILLKGTVLPPPDEEERGIKKPRGSEMYWIRVKAIETPNNAKTDSRFLE
jgi:hypothetical protein